MIKFSIVVPIFNVERYLKECVDSLINQTFSNIEIILVDDGSTDLSSTLCDNFVNQDKRIRVIHKKNGGLVSARIAGALAASGDYICCVDGDDYIPLNYIENFFKVANVYSPDIICSGYNLKSEKKCIEKAIPYRYGYYSKKEIEAEIYPDLIQNANASYFSPNLWSKAFKKDLYVRQQQAVDPRIKIGEDGACVIPCIYYATSIYIMPECMYYYRYNESSMTKNKKAFDWRGPKLIAEHILNQIDINQFDFQEQLYRKIVHELFSVVISQFNRKESYRTVVRDIRQKLKEPIYKEAIKCANFKGKAGKIALFALKYQCMLVMKIYHSIKK